MSDVAMSAPLRSASLRIASPAPDHLAPRPATITGRFAFVMRADPDDRLIEADETNNASWVDVALR